MSIDFTILCTRPPERFLRKRAEWLKWDARRGSGSFGGMSLWLSELEDDDPLPGPEWAERVVVVLRANGRLSDDTFDDFDCWTEALADATHGAIYSHAADSFIHVWADADAKRTAAHTQELLDAGDRAVQLKAEQQRQRRLQEGAAAAPWPADLAALQRLIDEVLSGDQDALARFERFTGYDMDNLPLRQKLVIALAKSGRELPSMLSSRLVASVYYVPELRSAAAREQFAARGALARQIAARLPPCERSAEEQREARARTIAERTAEYDALYGRDRDRPRMPDDIIGLIRRGRLNAAIAAYGERFPKLARKAQQAVEDARAFFAPDTGPAEASEAATPPVRRRRSPQR